MSDVRIWLEAFASALAAQDGIAVSDLFIGNGLWRDFLSFGWTLETHEGCDAIAKFAAARASETGATAWNATPGVSDGEGFLSFETATGRGKGYVRLIDGKCLSLFTMLEELKGFEEPLRARRVSGIVSDAQGRNWKDLLAAEAASLGVTEQPYALVIGAGQGGLALGARLRMLGVPCLLIDKHPRVGGQWRSRYKSLTLHDPVWYDHLPYLPFPDQWPVFTPKDKMADWLEFYASVMELNVWNSTECVSAEFDEASGRWRVRVLREGRELTLSPIHLVMAVGNAGFPRVPEIRGQEQFRGTQYHSSAHRGGEGMAGKRVVIVGANNSAHDIAADLVINGGEPIMIQRSSTLIVRQSTMCDILLKPVYSQEAVDAGITTDRADLLNASVPLRLQETLNKKAWDRIRVLEAPFYQRLEDAGFKLDFGEDGTGLSMKFQRSASGYYIDVGACEMIIDGRIKLHSGVNIDRIVEDGLILDNGIHIAADMIVYATGFGSMEEWVARLIGPEVAERVGRCGGYGSGFKGDPGPWEGELRNFWKPTAQEGLWFMGGNLAQTRIYSRFLAIQLKARFEGLALQPYAH